jgi:hypothetical protein
VLTDDFENRRSLGTINKICSNPVNLLQKMQKNESYNGIIGC